MENNGVKAVLIIGGSALVYFYLEYFLALLGAVFFVFLFLPYFFRTGYPKILYFIFCRGRKIVGNPSIAITHWTYQHGPTCAINTQAMVLGVFGINKNIADLSRRQESQGTFFEGKGATSSVTLLKGYGLDVSEVSLGKIGEKGFFLWKNLRKGRLVICGANLYVLNNPDSQFRPSKDPAADHAILVTGMRSCKGLVEVFYSDTGVFDGSIKVLPLPDFEAAISAKAWATVKLPSYRRKQKEFLVESIRKVVCCPSCRTALRFSFGGSGYVRCGNCSSKFFIEEKGRCRAS